MFTAIRRIAKLKTENSETPHPTRPSSISSVLQKKFSRGVQYNMKIVIKGDKCSGKTSLFRRLQGKNLAEEYKPTEGIQVANIEWNYKNVDDVVKVEVWDVVDRGKEIRLDAGNNVKASLDAAFVDVYKGTNGVILIMDVTKNWTFTYVQYEISRIPVHLPVLILGNRCDMGHHQKIPEEDVRHFIQTVQRPSNMAQIMYTEASMVNGYGLMYIHKFLALPFLHLRQTVLKNQLNRNAEETQIALQEIDLYQSSKEATYSKYSEKLLWKRRKIAEDLGVHSPSSKPGTPSVVFGLGRPINWKPTQRQHVKDTHRMEENRHNSNVEGGSVEEFVPEEKQLDDAFFQGSPVDNVDHSSCHPEDSSDSDSQGNANPLVATLQEDVDTNEEFYRHFPKLTKKCHPEASDKSSFPPSEATGEIPMFSDSNHKKQAQSIDGGIEEREPDVATKKHGTSRGRKHLEATEGDSSKSSKSRRKQKNSKKEPQVKEENKKKSDDFPVERMNFFQQFPPSSEELRMNNSAIS